MDILCDAQLRILVATDRAHARTQRPGSGPSIPKFARYKMALSSTSLNSCSRSKQRRRVVPKAKEICGTTFSFWRAGFVAEWLSDQFVKTFYRGEYNWPRIPQRRKRDYTAPI